MTIDRTATITATQVVRTTYGSVDALEHRTTTLGPLEPHQVLVEIKAAAVNPYDVHMMTGTPYLARLQAGLRRPKDPTLGVDMSGTIMQVGSEVTNVSPGDDVFGVLPGSFATHGIARGDRVVAKPERLSFEEAAGIPLASTTALQAMRKGGLSAGQRVLINGASGGIGTQAVQIAKAHGAEVTAVASTRNVDMVKTLGPDHVIDYLEEDFTRTGPYDLILDTVGLRKLSDVSNALADNGVYVTVGGPKKTFPMLGRILSMVVRSWFSSKSYKAMIAAYTLEDFELMQQWIESDELSPVIERIYSLDETAEALQNQIDGHAQGKTIISVDSTERA